jgi:ribonuclease M5
MEKKTEITKMPMIKYPIIVEGRYDKSAILGMYRATVITTEGFGIFNSKERQALVRRIAKDGVILLTDSDGGGKQIRSFVCGIVPKDKIYQLYIPEIEGKERRKTKVSRAGLLGVEGIGADVLRKLLDPFTLEGDVHTGDITPALMYALGLSGGEGSLARRDTVCMHFGLPSGMSAKSLLAALNIITDSESLREVVQQIEKN